MIKYACLFSLVSTLPVFSMQETIQVFLDKMRSEQDARQVAMIHAGDAEGVEEFLSQGASADLKVGICYYALHAAIALKDASMVETLLHGGADVDLAGPDGFTALHDAVLENETKLVSLLLRYNADPHCSLPDGTTPLHSAAKNGCNDSIFLLKEAGADLDVKNSRGCTPLFLAILAEQEEAVFYLLSYGADSNAQGTILVTCDHLSRHAFLRLTPLQLAVGLQNLTLIVRLLAVGTHVNAVSNKRRTALDYALLIKNAAIISLLETCGAKKAAELY